MREVVTWARSHPDIDSEHIGVWGTSYSGGHALMMGALDRRISAVVAQVPLVDGDGFFGASLKGGGGEKFLERLALDRDGRQAGEPAKTIRAAPGGSTTADWAAATDAEGVWPNRMTLRSLEAVASYMPVNHTKRISPTPLLMLVANEDEVTPLEPQLAAFENAREPKRLVRFDCQHYDVYVPPLVDRSAAEARDFFVEHLSTA
jgi:acetyl esterase/lipase